jgi:hypothetical protein
LIITDTREHEYEFIVSTFRNLGIDTEVTCLQHGMDYLILGDHGEIGVQRKTFPEICQQMTELREDILPALADLTENPVLLVEEHFIIDNNGAMYRKKGNMMEPANITARMYYNFCQTVRAMGIEIVSTKDLHDSIWWMYSVHAYIHEEHYPKQKKKYGVDMQARGVLCCINSFGPTKATKLLKDNTIAGLISMSDAQLSKLLSVNQLINFRKVMGYLSK